MQHLGGTVSSCPLTWAAGKTQHEAELLHLRSAANGAQSAEHPLKLRGGPGHGPCLKAGFTSWGSPWLQHIFSASHPPKRNLAVHILCPQRRGCLGAPCNVTFISRGFLLTPLSTEAGENELCSKVKLLVCFASEELSECGRAGSSPWELGCKSLGWIVTNSRSWRFPGV